MSDRYNLFSRIHGIVILAVSDRGFHSHQGVLSGHIHEFFQNLRHRERTSLARRSQVRQRVLFQEVRNLQEVRSGTMMMFQRRRRTTPGRGDTLAVLRSLDDWQELISANPQFRDREYIDRLAKAVCDAGATEPLTGMRIPPGQLQCSGNLREGLVYSSINSRMRAVMFCIQLCQADQPASQTKIYATEAVTPFALRLRGIFAKFIGSEYTESEAQREELYPISCEDLQNLSFPNDVFDIVTTNEVLEHVPSIDTALAEIHRVLRPGGWHVGTAPFAMGQTQSITKARLEDGKVVYLMEAEYHGNPVDERGSLVFEIPGWDLLERAQEVGFGDAHVKYIISTKHACLSSDAGGIFVFCLQKKP